MRKRHWLLAGSVIAFGSICGTLAVDQTPASLPFEGSNLELVAPQLFTGDGAGIQTASHREDGDEAAAEGIPRLSLNEPPSSEGMVLVGHQEEVETRDGSGFDPAYDGSSHQGCDSCIHGGCAGCTGDACGLARRGGKRRGSLFGGCGLSGCDSGECGLDHCAPCGGEPWKLFDSDSLDCRGIEIGGWIDQGISVVSNNPADRYNGVVGYNDRDGEYQMNQFWLFLEKAVDNGGCGWAIGGRVDFAYGTDGRFLQAVDGLEANWNQTEPFYQAALPQFYFDVAYNKFTLRMGHFLTPIGYEVADAPANFFYSHSYAYMYAETLTHTGALLTYDVNDRFNFSVGVHRGLDQFDDTDGLDSLGFLGGMNWTSCDGRKSLALALSSSEQGPGNVVLLYSIVGGLQLSDRLKYIIQHNYGQSAGSAVATSEWYGLNQYFEYKINSCWAAALRFEVLRDDDGTRVTGLGPGNLNTGPFVGDFYEVSLGVNWKPHRNWVLRPELRWDWYEANSAGGPLPFDAGDRSSQFMAACDLIVTF